MGPVATVLRQSRSRVKNPQQIAIRIQSGFLCCLNEAVNNRTGLCASGRVGEKPVLSAHHKWLDATLSTIVGEL